MRQLRGNPRIGQRDARTFYGSLTVKEALEMRTDEAKLAEYCASRVTQARAAAQYGAMRHWTREYRRAAAQCRVLGEQIRRVSGRPQPTAAVSKRTVAPLTPRPGAGVRSAGEAA